MIRQNPKFTVDGGEVGLYLGSKLEFQCVKQKKLAGWEGRFTPAQVPSALNLEWSGHSSGG